MVFRNNPIQTTHSGPALRPSIAMKMMQDIPEVKYPAVMAGQDRPNFLRVNSEVLTRGAIRIIEGKTV